MLEHKRKGFIDLIAWSMSRVLMYMPALILVIMLYEVVCRYIFAAPTLWVNEMSLWLAGMTYLAAGLYAMQQRSHIRIFLIYDMLPRKLKKLCDVISTTGIVLFAAATVWGGYGEALRRLMAWERFGTAWNPPIPATMKSLILIAVVAVALQAVSNLITDWAPKMDEEDNQGEEASEHQTEKPPLGRGQ